MEQLRIYNTLEIPTQEEWDKYLGAYLFKQLEIDIDKFKISDDFETGMVYDVLHCWIKHYNNKVGSLNITYILVRHYFEKGIPDDEWIISPGRNGQSLEYMPHFEPQHWLIRYWFNYYAEIMYFKFFSIWDLIIGLLNIFYQMNFSEDYRLKKNVLNYLKNNKSDLFELLQDILKEPIYMKANNYRINIMHSLSPNDIVYKNDHGYVDETEFFDVDENGDWVTRKLKDVYQISMTVGEYVTTREVMENIDEFLYFTGKKITQILDIIKTDEFLFKMSTKKLTPKVIKDKQKMNA